MNATTRNLREMREILATTSATPFERKAIEGAVFVVERYWLDRKRGQYEEAMAVRTQQYDQIALTTIAHIREAGELREGVETGKISTKNARAWLRDALATHARLHQQCQAIVETEDEYAALDAMTVEDYQERQMARFPHLQQAAPSLQAAMNKFMSEA